MSSNNNLSLSPFVKWAGGKRQIKEIIIKMIPKEFNTYFEPFLGGGAIFFELKPKKAYINDINKNLMDIYSCFTNENYFNNLVDELNKLEKLHSEKTYYEIRSMDKDHRFNLLPIWVKAGRTIYLNKSCFNGLYRVNSKGFFNVPFGKKEKVTLYSKENFDNIKKYFANNEIKIYSENYIDIVSNAKENDFIYFDPPYDNLDDKNSFTTYTEYDFNKEDQVKLSNVFKELDKRNVKLMLSNHNTKLIRELYKDYKITIVKAKRMINSNASKRGKIEEVIITNY